MEKRQAIAWMVLGGFVLWAGWWGLVPKIGTATEAEVRAHVAPELLQPLPHPPGGIARFEALQRALARLPATPQRAREAQAPPGLSDPVVGDVIGILRAGPIDRTTGNPVRLGYANVGAAYSFDGFDPGRYTLFLQLVKVANGLWDAALWAADQGEWAAAGKNFEASTLLLQRLFESDARLQDRRETMSMETAEYRAALKLAAHRGLPAAAAARLSELLAVDRHDSASLMQALRGEMQYVLVPRIGVGPISYYEAGTYAPLETAELMGARFLQAVREAGSPGDGRSSDRASLAWKRSQLTSSFWMVGSAQRGRSMHPLSYLAWPAQRIRLNTSRNSIGRVDAETCLPGDLPDAVRRARTRQDQVLAALAVVRFRQRAGRDPHDFSELVVAGLLRAAPMDHLRNQPLPFDLKALFEWREVRPA